MTNLRVLLRHFCAQLFLPLVQRRQQFIPSFRQLRGQIVLLAQVCF